MNTSCRKLTDEQVKEIRYLYATTSKSYRDLAKKFKVSYQTIFNVVNKKSHKHLN